MKKVTKAVIPAAGLGTRVLPATKAMPQETLRKILDNPPQSGLEDADARRANVLGAYEAVHPERIAGKRFLLVDDICTTGSTLGEAARVLRQAGAADVLGLTLAVTREE